MTSNIRLKTWLEGNRGIVEQALKEITAKEIVARFWKQDYTIWKPSPQEIANRLGWMTIAAEMGKEIATISSLVDEVRNEGFENVLVLGMGGSSLAPELFAKTFTQPNPPFQVRILDSTDPDYIRFVESQLDIEKTLFIVATKSGGTVETRSFFKYFYRQVRKFKHEEQAGNQFIAITDPGSKLIDLANRYQFRRIFLNNPNIGGRYSALSFFGLVPAAFAGVDLAMLLEKADNQAALAKIESPIEDNPAVVLGAVIGELAKNGKDKLTIITSPELSNFGDWVEQLIAESTGKEGTGILPVVQEPMGEPGVYGNDRIFVFITLGNSNLHQSIETLRQNRHPVVEISLQSLYDIGGLFFLWEFATAIAGYRLGINPFDQPNVESAKILARRMVSVYLENGSLPAMDSHPVSASVLKTFLARAKSGDYLAIQAFINPSAEARRVLNQVRVSLRNHYKLATTLGFGPRFLHSTGQYHKGGRANGIFIQITSSPINDTPIPETADSDQSGISFGTLKLAQALGDAQALKNANRHVLRLHTSNDELSSLIRLADISS